MNRIEIVGNDYTHESCIREQIVLAPGQLFNRNYLIRSYQNIGNLNFFETPMAAPETRPSGEQGDVDIVFNVKEKRTGNVNFGASWPGHRPGGSSDWIIPPSCPLQGLLCVQYGLQNQRFNATYSDPNILQSRMSGSLRLITAVPLHSPTGRPSGRAARCNWAFRCRAPSTLDSSSHTAARR